MPFDVNNEVGEPDTAPVETTRKMQDLNPGIAGNGEDGTRAAVEGVGLEGDDSSGQSSVRQPIPDMVMSLQEKEWAWDLIQHVDGDEFLRELKDFEYAHYAILTRGNHDDAMRRIRGVQIFRDYYSVQDSVEEGIEILEKFVELQPEVLLNLVFEPGRESSVVWDQAKFHPCKCLASEQAMRTTVLAHYYLLQIMQPTLQACRDGLSFLVFPVVGAP